MNDEPDKKDEKFGIDPTRDGFESDPVHQFDGKWWFFDETWADRVGPYQTEDRCRRALFEYALALGGG